MGWFHTKTRQRRGYGRAWEHVRKRILARDNYLCKNCERHGIITPLTTGNRSNPSNATVDHVVAKAFGGKNNDSNLESLCTDCHKRKTVADSIKSRAAWRASKQACAASGQPLDASHHWNTEPAGKP